MKNFKHKFVFTLVIFLSVVLSLYAQSPIPQGAIPEMIVSGTLQPEGPVWKDGLGLLFSDIQASKIYCWNPVDKSLKSYIDTSYNSNGLTYDLQGRLILTQMGKRRVSRQELNGTIAVLASIYEGKKFNCPNDLVVKSDGSIFFTDPDFNVPGGSNNKELSFQGIYRISPTGSLSLLDKTLKEPNGICFSLDEKKLFVNESAKDSIYVWDIINDSTLANKRGFYAIPMSGFADGMKIDPAGNLYCAGPTGVWIISPSGTYVDKIPLPNNGSASNCAWGDADRKTLFITSGSPGTSVYKIRLNILSGVEEKHGSVLPNNFELFQNYPNPFNPETTISYRLSAACRVSLKIYDLLGREVETLVNEEQLPGNYNSKFSIKNLHAGRQGFQFSSGVYFYTLIAGDFAKTKKLLLMK